MGTALVLLLFGLGSLAAGILVGRYYVPDDRELKRSARHASAYMRAINQLLARDRDAAVDELVAVVRENVDEIEPYFALGALFRSRGEHERAIRVHQAISLRAGKDRKIRLRAKYELGLDFRAAGMPRRATRAMEECLAEDSKHSGAARALGSLYEEQGRYAEAAAIWTRLRKRDERGMPRREHHLLVAAAQQAIAASDLESARRLLREAERLDDASPHFLMVAAEVALARNNPEGARERLRQALVARPELARFVLGGLRSVEGELVDAADGELSAEERDTEIARRAVACLDGVLAEAGPEPHVALVRANLRSTYDAAGALEELREIGENHPEVLAARLAAGRLALAGDDDDEIRAELRALVDREGVLGWVCEVSWRCGRCGHLQDEFFWRCQRCRHWGSVCLEVGGAGDRVYEEPPRERRSGTRSEALILSGGKRALPTPSLESGLSSTELAEVRRRTGAVGRAGAWLSGAWSTIRGGRKSSPSADDR